MLQTGSYLPMNYFLKEKLKDRLQYCMEWQKNAETYLFHKSITAEVDKNFYNNKPIIKIFLNIYFLPMNLLKFLKLIRFLHDLRKNQVEIDLIYKQLNEREIEK